MNTTPADADHDLRPAGQLFDLGEPLPKPATESPALPTPRLRLAQRLQGEMRTASLDELLPPDHEVRVVWDYVCQLDLTPLLQAIRAVPGTPGRNATDPRILLALWLLLPSTASAAPALSTACAANTSPINGCAAASA